MNDNDQRIWVVHADDNVGTVAGAGKGGVSRGSRLAVAGAYDGTVEASQDIPFGHKLALKAMSSGAPVIKYGKTIGRLTADVGPGEHVHSHNMESTRGRGDLLRK